MRICASVAVKKKMEKLKFSGNEEDFFYRSNGFSYRNDERL